MKMMSNFWRAIIEAIVQIVLDYLQNKNNKK